MYGRERWVLLRHKLAQGLSKAALAQQLGISRRTLYQRLATGQLDRELDHQPMRYRPRPTVVRNIDPNRDLIPERQAAYPQLSADVAGQRGPGPQRIPPRSDASPRSGSRPTVDRSRPSSDIRCARQQTALRGNNG